MRVCATIILVFAWLAWAGCERQHSERVIGDYGSQPPTTITTLSKDKSVDVGPVIDSAKRALAPSGDSLWPEPSQVVERRVTWTVWFEYRQKVVEVNGKRLISEQLPTGAMVEVQKSDLSARVIPGR